jgi:hypothetical protein
VSYTRDIRIEFNHCDPAGIVFFPRYFEMINSMTENFFRDRLDYPFERIVLGERSSVPTVHLEIDFRAPPGWARWCVSRSRLPGWGVHRSICATGRRGRGWCGWKRISAWSGLKKTAAPPPGRRN